MSKPVPRRSVSLIPSCLSLSQYLFTEEYNKPFFTVYFKTTLFSIYLVAFVFWRPWQRLCCKCGNCRSNRRRTGNIESDSQVKLPSVISQSMRYPALILGLTFMQDAVMLSSSMLDLCPLTRAAHLV